MTLYKGDKVIAGSRSYIGNIGDIKYTARVDLPFGGSWCDGSIKLKAQFPTVYQMLIDGKLQALDIATYESALNLNGSCGFFGLDTATESFRVPSLNDVYIKSGQVADEFGAESLPNITGNMPGFPIWGNAGENFGAFSNRASADNNGAGASGRTQYFVDFDASRSSSTYQDGAKVNPDHVKYRAYVVLYTGVDTNIDITKEIQLNNPFSFGMSQWFESDPKNASWLLSNGAFHSGAIYESFYNWLLSILNGEAVEGVSVKSSTDTYGDYDYVVNTSEATFRLPVKTHLASGNAVAGNGMTLGMTNGTDNFGTVHGLTGVNGAMGIYTGNYGDNVASSHTTSQYNKEQGIIGVTTDPTKSGIETSSQGLMLYFYVGDVVSDANLLNAGKVLDLLAKLESYDYVVESKTSTAEDPTWYRLYKSGWVEQGGFFTPTTDQLLGDGSKIVLPKEMKDKNYSVEGTQCVLVYSGSTSNNVVIACATSTKEINITQYGSSGHRISWKVSGQSA